MRVKYLNNSKKDFLANQKNEITESFIYEKLAAAAKTENDRSVLGHIAAKEKDHYQIWLSLTDTKVEPDRWRIFFYSTIAKIFGLNFGLRLMERGEKLSQSVYADLKSIDPRMVEVIGDEQNHEQELLNLIDQRELAYVGSLILGMNDALVELTGTLAGLTFAFAQTHLIAFIGLITGFAASLSMAGSEYLAKREEEGKNPIKSGLATGLSYILTVILLVLPYLILGQPIFALLVTLSLAVVVILFFNFYIAIARNIKFKRRFFEMLMITLTVSILSFSIGFIAKTYFKVGI